jgi:formate-dependent nitrite reductase cytochrome c552 subunit
MKEKELFIGIGILVMLLALAGTVSASHDGSKGFACNNCHAITPENATFYNQTHRYNETLINPPNCDLCHVSVATTPFNMDLSLKKGTPTYLTSTTCQACHKTKYDKWSNTLHAVMLTPRDKAQAMNLPTPYVGWANISYVIVTKFQFAYINTTGYFLAQNDEYNTENMKWENSTHAGGAYGTCGRCHTTNWNASASNSSLPGFNGTFSEPGIACERCHEPAGNGHQVVVNYSGDSCRECHTGNNHGTGWENGEHAPPPYENGSNCMFCHSSFDQYRNQNVTTANATGVSCGVCHNIHDMTDNKYAATFSEDNFNATTWSEVADSKLSFFNATASYISLTGGSTGTLGAGNDIFDTLVSPALLYPGNDASRKDASYGTAPINVTGPVSEVLCSKCHYRHGLAHTASVNLTHSRMNYPQSEWATCTDCHMAGTNATVGKDMMKNHANDPLTPNSCGGTTKCHTTSAQNLSMSSHSVIPNMNEWNGSAHNDMEVGVNKNPNSSFYRSINGTTGVVTTASRMNSCDKCHSPFNWNPLTDFNSNGTQNTATVKLTPDNFKGIICAVCHNFHDMGDWLKKTNATFGEAKAYAWYNKDAVVAATNATTGAITRYKANYTMMSNTTELCGNCHSNIRIGNEGPGWNGSGGNPTGVHGFPAKDVFDGSYKQTVLNFECIDCHMSTMITDSNGSLLPDSQKVKGHSFKVNATILMNGTTCSSCHVTGSTLGNLSATIENIQAQTRDKWNATNITVLGALATIKAYNGEKNLSRDKIAQAYWNLRLVSSDESWGVHNPVKVNNLLNESSTLANDAIEALGSTATGKPNITSFSPTTPTVIDVVGGPTRTFSITVNQAVNVSWQINEAEVTNETGVTTSSYPISSAIQGTRNVTAVAQNDNGSAMQKWTWVVNPISSGTGSISGMKFNDLNNNSIKDSGETALAGWTIVLTGGTTATMTTDANGSYTFSNLAQGNYTVAEVLKPDWKQTLPANGTYNVTIAGGENLTGMDFGNNLPVPPPVNGTIAVRMIEKGSLLLGESTNITVDISSNMSQALALHEIIPAGWNLTRISDDADAFKNSTSESIWFNVSPGINKTVIYRLTAPDNASIGTYHINGTISSASGVIAVVQGDNTITLDIKAFYRRLGSDTNIVETTDVLTAAEDWRNNKAPAGFEQAITTQEFLSLIDEWMRN